MFHAWKNRTCAAPFAFLGVFDPEPEARVFFVVVVVYFFLFLIFREGQTTVSVEFLWSFIFP